MSGEENLDEEGATGAALLEKKKERKTYDEDASLPDASEALHSDIDADMEDDDEDDEGLTGGLMTKEEEKGMKNQHSLDTQKGSLSKFKSFLKEVKFFNTKKGETICLTTIIVPVSVGKILL